MGRPAVLPSKFSEPLLGKDCIMFGYGAEEKYHLRTGYSGWTTNYPVNLKMAIMPVYSNLQCNDPAWRGCTIRSGMICAGGQDDRPCDGDSGGPLFCPYLGDENVYVLEGVYSYGRCTRDITKPAVFTRVSHYYDWIQNTIESNR